MIIRDGFKCLLKQASRIFRFKRCNRAVDNIIQSNLCPGLFLKCLKGCNLLFTYSCLSILVVGFVMVWVIISTSTNSLVSVTSKMLNVILNNDLIFFVTQMMLSLIHYL